MYNRNRCKKQAFACEPDAPIVELHDPVFQLGGELRPHRHKENGDSKGDSGGGNLTSFPEDNVPSSEAPDVEGAVDAREYARDKEGAGVQDEEEEGEVALIIGAGAKRTRQLRFGGRLLGETEDGEEVRVTSGNQQGEENTRSTRRLHGDGLEEDEEGSAGKETKKEASGGMRVTVASGGNLEAPGIAAAAGTSSDDKRGREQQQQQQEDRLLEQRTRKGHRGRAKRDARRGLAGAAAASGGDGVVEGGGREGNSSGGEDSGGSPGSCESAFPLATTVLAWASGFAILVMYRLLPPQSAASKGHGPGLP